MDIKVRRGSRTIITIATQPDIGLPRIGDHLDIDEAGMVYTNSRRYRVVDVRWRFDTGSDLSGIDVFVEDEKI